MYMYIIDQFKNYDHKIVNTLHYIIFDQFANSGLVSSRQVRVDLMLKN